MNHSTKKISCANQDKLEFYKIKEIWSDYALTEEAKRQINEIQPLLSERELEAKLRETTESRKMIEKCGNPPLVSMNGLAELVAAAERGEVLGAEELTEIAGALTAVKRLKSYLCRGKQMEISLAFYEENLDPLELVRDEIENCIMTDYVADGASSLLKSLRTHILMAEDKMREKADAVIRANRECMSDHFSTFRNGRICVPVKKEYKFRIPGSVIDKSATGNTLFIEPTASARYFEELQELRLEEENEVRRILYELTGLVADEAGVFRQNIRTMERLDFAFSKGKLSLHYDGIEPAIITERRIRLTNARHPLMKKEICVPLQFSIGDGINGVVITGPNTGGKTVALKTVALNCMMAQCGLHVSCEKAVICMNSNYLCDIGDGQNLSENLSTFSAHITNVLDILRRVNSESLVVMDELGSGTDPLEGMGIAVAILEELRKSGALFLVTTHYPEVKVYAEKTNGIVNARMTFDKENLQPLYQMVIGEAGESCAFHIAKRLGMPEGMLRKATEAAYGAGAEQKGDVGYETGIEQKGKTSFRAGAEQKRDSGYENGAEQKCDSKYEVDAKAAPGNSYNKFRKESVPKIQKKKIPASKKQISFNRGDSVMILPDKKKGIVCQRANDKGVLQVQLPGKKIWINHKRVKLLVEAVELYPEDYDFSIVFDTVENRKLRHQMERRYVEGAEVCITEE